MKLKKVIEAWLEASSDLNIKIRSPFILTTPDNQELRFELLIENFGRKKGTVILSANDMTDFDTPEKYGYYCSALNPSSYSTYDRKHFMDTLNDWGYCGEEALKPDWYNGKVWTD